MTSSFKIHPAIGVARLGNSPDYYIAPNQAGQLPLNSDGQETTAFRDGQQQLKRQAAQFSIYVYDDDNPTGRELKIGDSVPTENGTATVEEIHWTVYLANKKAVWYQFQQLAGIDGYASTHPRRNQAITDSQARQRLIIDPGPLTLTEPNQRAEFTLGRAQNNYPQNFPPQDTNPFVINTLGEILTEADGNLLVLGGQGHSGSTLPPVITAYANNPGWFDDISDGPVSATLVLSDGSTPEVLAAWVLVAPPAYAPQILNMVTLYDAIYDVFVRNFDYNENLYDKDNGFNPNYNPDYDTEIGPIVGRPDIYRWVTNMPSTGIGQHSLLPGFKDFGQDFPFGIVRHPDMPSGTPVQMPGLAGDDPITQPPPANFLTVTQTQYQLLQNWHTPITTGSGSSVPPLSEGEKLDKATLENCVGGAFCPGIEMTWICRNPTIYMPYTPGSRPADAFRIKHKPLTGPGLSQTNGSNGDYSEGLEPGDISKYMALPWQADFHECSSQGSVEGSSGAMNPLWWWPAQRPYYVHPQADPEAPPVPWTRPIPPDHEGDLQMVSDWKELGFVIEQGNQYVEVQRTLPEVGAMELAHVAKEEGLEA